MNKVLLEFLSKTLSLDENGVTSLFNEDGSPKDDSLQKFLELDAARVAKLQKGKFDEGVKKAQKDVMSKFETDLKTKLGIESDKVGVELVEEIIASKTPQGTELSEEQVTKSKWYLDLKENQQKAIKEAVKAKETEHNNYKAQVERNQALSVVKQKALTLFESLKPILSSDPAKAAKQKEVFLKQFDQDNYRMEGERIILLNPDGTDRTDPHGIRVEFDSFVKESASSLYDFQVIDPKASPAGGSGNAGAGGAGKPVVVKDESDFMKQFHEAKTPADKIAVSKAWEEVKKASQ
jgi:hypothetical protein